MGSLPTLLCCDFRQMLPVIPGGTRANVVDAFIKRSVLWHNVLVYNLTTNMRALKSGNKDIDHFIKMLLNVGNGVSPHISDPDIISSAEFVTQVNSEEELISKVFPDIKSSYHNQTPEWVTQRAILAPLNKKKLNKALINHVPGELITFTAINSVVNEEETVQYPAVSQFHRAVWITSSSTQHQNRSSCHAAEISSNTRINEWYQMYRNQH
ncbi:hypothetical protein ElyMa_004961000 [Elysia marginata]|uniref:ATP-dependent DNA helicase n=1 Tax=Elysia marginata TaxID=1093978 RepID=A0AAV4J1I4_9GAST|nr:hypothetical protein ElyMa_004961000 [Elysia marginata]